MPVPCHPKARETLIPTTSCPRTYPRATRRRISVIAFVCPEGPERTHRVHLDLGLSVRDSTTSSASVCQPFLLTQTVFFPALPSMARRQRHLQASAIHVAGGRAAHGVGRRRTVGRTPSSMSHPSDLVVQRPERSIDAGRPTRGDGDGDGAEAYL